MTAASLKLPDRPQSLRPAPSKAPVLIAGTITTAASLVTVYGLSRVGFDAMSFYADYVIPVGSIAVGLLAAAGFGIASWKTGCKVSGTLLVSMLAILAAGWGLAHYLQFRLAYPEGAFLKDGTPLGFVAYFDLSTRSMSFTEHGKEGDALGLLGYGVRALDLLGFVGGGVAIPWAMRSRPYCDLCALYMRTRKFGQIPNGLAPRSFAIGKEKPERIEERKKVQESAASALAEIRDATALGAAALKEALSKHATPKKGLRASRLESVFAIDLIHCQRCSNGYLATTEMTRNGNKRAQHEVLERRRPLSAAMVDELCA